MIRTLTAVIVAIATLGCATAALADAAMEEGLAKLGIRVERTPGASTFQPAPFIADRPADALPDSQPGHGRNDIETAWLVAPTTRYSHGILGDTTEAAGLRVTMANGQQLVFQLDSDSVFEDLQPRVVDLDGDGRDEVMVVRTYLNRGAALAVFAVRGGDLYLRAETRPIGRSNRWLNPVGVGDFDGDGTLEVAYVETPHIGGTLRIFTLKGNRLTEDGKLSGFSNHGIGSKNLGLSAILDVDGDGSDDLLIPGDGRRNLRIVSFAGGKFRELGRVNHSAAITTDFTLRDRDGNGRPDVAYGLADGSLIVLYR